MLWQNIMNFCGMGWVRELVSRGTKANRDSSTSSDHHTISVFAGGTRGQWHSHHGSNMSVLLQGNSTATFQYPQFTK